MVSVFMKQKKLFSVQRGGAGAKGFIGPIGDDLPSLIPIVVGLLLFFMTFAMVLSAYNTKNALISQQSEMTSVARELKGDSLIFGVDWFLGNCQKLALKNYPYSYAVALYPTNLPIKDVSNDFMLSTSGTGIPPDNPFILAKNGAGNTVPYYCQHFKIGAKPFTTQNRTYMLRFYPVAVQREITVNGKINVVTVPALMAMVFWT